MDNYALGEVAFIRFCGLVRRLTLDELSTFRATGNLPPGVGYDSPSTFLEVQAPNAETPTVLSLAGGDFTEQAIGSYYAQIQMRVTGDGWWRGYGQDQNANPQWSTRRQHFSVGT